MKRAILLISSAIAAFSSLAGEAFARPYYGDRHQYVYDRHEEYVHRRFWHGRPYVYRPYYWQPVTVYTPPEYYTNGYSEVRCVDSYNPFGTLLGAGLGGLAGSTIGHHGGRVAAVAGGAMLGAIIGNGLTQQHCSTEVFRDVPLGQPVSWQAAPDEAYAVVPVRETNLNGRYCREYQSYAMVGGQRSETYGTACMQPDGSWQIVN